MGLGLPSCSDTDDMMRIKLKPFERKRFSQIWHDGSELANHGYVFLAIDVLYDPAVFCTDAEIPSTERPYTSLIQKFC